MTPAAHQGVSGLVFDMDTFAVHDGPGIRMAVYFKGCPLRCQWCHSPESQLARPELVFMSDRCTRCGACVAICSCDVHTVAGDGHNIERQRCKACGQCAANCPAGALAIKGQSLSADSIVDKAARLKPFFGPSGGVTLTGGEVTMQADFAAAILQGCHARGIHTAIETCGACDWPVLERLADLCDLILYDLKLLDDRLHREWTGASNRQILANARRLSGRNVTVRVPLIPGITDTVQNVSEIAAFMRDANLSDLVLLPYNSSAAAKYEWLGRRYMVAAPAPSSQSIDILLAAARASALHVALG